MSQTSFDNHLLVQEVLERCFLQGWFSPSDATKLLEMPDCRLAPWNSRQYASLYPRIETEIRNWELDWYESQVSKWLLRESLNAGINDD